MEAYPHNVTVAGFMIVLAMAGLLALAVTPENQKRRKK